MDLSYVRVQIILFGESLGALIAAMQEIVERPLVAGLLALVDEQVTAVAHLPHQFAADLALNRHQHICNFLAHDPQNINISEAHRLRFTTMKYGRHPCFFSLPNLDLLSALLLLIVFTTHSS